MKRRRRKPTPAETRAWHEARMAEGFHGKFPWHLIHQICVEHLEAYESDLQNGLLGGQFLDEYLENEKEKRRWQLSKSRSSPRTAPADRRG